MQLMARLSKDNERGYLEKRAFARVLMTLREERGMTQETLAFDSGYHPKYISLLERGQYSPSLTAILEISKALEITGAELVRRVESLLPGNRRRRRETG
ncbi:MAG: helix-turn-helix transcriptional regulator [Candidatus Acidiferrales bacterium]|jgi:transcriptional regulator with XRE-family HTH domain